MSGHTQICVLFYLYLCVCSAGQCGEHGIAVSASAALREGLHRVQLAAGGGSGPAGRPGAPWLRVGGTGACPGRGLLRRTLSDRAGVAHEGEHARKC